MSGCSIGMDFMMDETPLLLEVARDLEKKHGHTVTGITLGNRWGKKVDECGCQISNLGWFLKENWDDFDISPPALAELEDQYGTPFLSDIIYADKYFVRSVHPRSPSRDYILKMLVGHFRFWERFLRERKIDVVVGPGIQALYDITRLRVMQRADKRFMGLYTTRLPSGRFVTCSNRVDRWDRVMQRFETLNDKGMSQEERDRAEQFLERFRAEHSAPGYMNLEWKSPALKMPFLKEFAKRLKRYYVEGWGRHPDYVTPHPLWSAYSKGMRILMGGCWNRLAGTFDEPREDEPFVLFPLHYQPEASTLVWSPYFVNQISVVENLAKSIPVTHKLYVKEHFSSIGRRPRGYYKRLRELPNVRLIAPTADSHTLMRRSDLNAVITSTLGWESLLYEKPVIVLGNVFYAYSGLAIRVTDMTQLPLTIEEALRGASVDRERLLQFIAAVFWGSHPGTFFMPHHNPSVMEKENVRQLASGIHRDIVASA